MNIEEIRKLILQGKTIYDLPLRVTYYGRVSSASDEQANSIVNQEDFFVNLIKENPNWVFVNGYIDEGISGKSTNKRDDFLRMIEDSKRNKFDLILTKSVPRFARNTVNSIMYTEELLKNNVGVYFLNDNINTILPDSEFRLTLMASIAQDDLRKLSENVKFGFKQSIERGVVLGANNIFGYQKAKGKLKIVEKEAEVIRLMFSLYSTTHNSFKKVSIELEKLGFLNSKGNSFDTTQIRRILTNPKYKGWYCGRKTATIDYKTGKRKKIDKKDWVMYPDNKKVPPIVSEELWDKVNGSISLKQSAYHNNQRFEYRNNYAYSSKLICVAHNVAYTRSGFKKGRINDYRYWSCREYKRGVKYCESPLLKESELDVIFKDIVKGFLSDRETILNSLLNRYRECFQDNSVQIRINNICRMIKNVTSKKDKLLELVIDGYINNEEFFKRNHKLSAELSDLEEKKQTLEKESEIGDSYEKRIKTVNETLNKEFNLDNSFIELMNILIDKIMISKIDDDRTRVKLDIIFKLGECSSILYDSKLTVLNQNINIPNVDLKVYENGIIAIPLADTNLNCSLRST